MSSKLLSRHFQINLLDFKAEYEFKSNFKIQNGCFFLFMNFGIYILTKGMYFPPKNMSCYI